MGLADRDYMRERAQDRGDWRPSGPPRKNGPLLVALIASGAVIAYLSTHPHPAQAPAPVVPAQEQQRAVETAAMQPSPVPVPSTPVEATTPVVVVPAPAAPQQMPDRRELVPVLNGARTQDLDHVVATSVGETDGRFPANGAAEWFVPVDPSHQTGRLTILDQEGTDTAKVVRIRQAETGFVIVQIYIQAGQGAFVDLPIGNYTLTVAEGDRWYGRPRYFGPEGAYFNALQLIQMSSAGATERLLPAGEEGRRMMAQPTYAF